jgi:hypothetical protein
MRTLLLRTWPASAWARGHYRGRFQGRGFERINQSARTAWRAAKPLDASQTDAVRALESEGIVVVDGASLLGTAQPIAAARAAAHALFDAPAAAAQIARRRSRSGGKWYVVRGLGLKRRGVIPDGLARVFLSERLLEVVNAYLGLCARLHYLDVWHNLPVRPGEPSISSERWHRDHEDRRLVKVFLLVEDVAPGQGPLLYLRTSQPGGALGGFHPACPPEGSAPPAHEMEAMIATAPVEMATGPAGTLVLFDSAGLHSGGRAVDRARIIATASFVSDAALDGHHYGVSPATAAWLGDAGRHALRLAGPVPGTRWLASQGTA